MKRKIAVLLCSFLIGSSVFSQSYEDALRPFQYVVPATGYSFVFGNNATLSRDVSSLLSNPANLGLAKRTLLLFSFQNNRLQQYSTPVGIGGSKFDSFEYTNFAGVGLLYNVPVYRGALAFGVAYLPVSAYDRLFTAEGFYRIWFESNPDTVYNKYKIQESGFLYSLSLGFAVEFRKNLFVGASLNSYSGYRTYDFEGVEIDTLDHFSHYFYKYVEKVEPEYRAKNVTFGLTYIYKSFVYGVRLSTPLRFKVEENSRVENQIIYDESMDETELYSDLYDLDYNVTYPLEFSTSIGYRSSLLEMSVTSTLHNWNRIRFESDIVDVEESGDTVNIDIRINSNIQSKLKQTMDWGFGAVLHVSKRFDLMFNYRIIPKPYKGLSRDCSRINEISIGARCSLGNLDVIASYKFLSTKDFIYVETFGTSTSQRVQEHRINITTVLSL